MLDTGAKSLLEIAKHHKIDVDLQALKKTVSTKDKPFDDQGILAAARTLGLRAKIANRPIQKLKTTRLPAIAQQKTGEYFVILNIARKPNRQQDKNTGDISHVCIIQEADKAQPSILSLVALSNTWTGQLTLFAKQRTTPKKESGLEALKLIAQHQEIPCNLKTKANKNSKNEPLFDDQTILKTSQQILSLAALKNAD